MNPGPGDPKGHRLLILASKLGYQTHGFAHAAENLGVAVVLGTDRCDRLEDPWRDGALSLRFEHPEEAARCITQLSQDARLDAILALGDRPTLTAAHAARSLGLPYNSPEAVEICHNKLRQREVLRAAGLPVPDFFAFALDQDPVAAAERASYPCVLKPLSLSASQGVIRAADEREFREAAERIRRLLASPEVMASREPNLDRLLVETYMPGTEVALEGVMDEGRLRTLAIFDKPDPLEGPYFEETIYVTPARLSEETRKTLLACAESSIQALGLTHGPVHAEYRIHEGKPFVLEVAPRPIGGLCSRALRFGPRRLLLEELLVRHALGLQGADLEREEAASGVMMIPVPASGVLEKVEGIEEARSIPGLEEVHITARLNDAIAAWPEGASYLGFLFARAPSPEAVVAALREAHALLGFTITPQLPQV